MRNGTFSEKEITFEMIPDKQYEREVLEEKSEKISNASRRSIKEREEILIAKGKGNIITDDLRRMWQAEIDKYGNMIQEEVLLN